MRELKPEDLRAYANRDWAWAEESKREWMAGEILRIGPSEALRRSARMDRDAAIFRPEGPAEEDRDEDLRHHIRLSELLRSVGRSGSRPNAR